MDIFEPKQGLILGKYDWIVKDEERPHECLTEWLEGADSKNRKMMSETSKEIEKSHAFENKCLYMNASYVGQEDQHLAKDVKKEEEDASVS